MNQHSLFIDAKQRQLAREYIAYTIQRSQPATVSDAEKIIKRWATNWLKHNPTDDCPKLRQARAVVDLCLDAPEAFNRLLTEVWEQATRGKAAG